MLTCWVFMLLLANIGQLITLRGSAGARRGAAMRDLGIVTGEAVLCSGREILAVGNLRDLKRVAGKNYREVDCGGRVMIPGFVDSHTHPAFMEPRLIDFEQRIAGSSYEEIAERGGGIRSSVNGVRRASRLTLSWRVLDALQVMNRCGTTTVEAKSGYGLDVQSEIKSLKAIRAAASDFSGTVVATLLGAHVVPREFTSNREEYIRVVCDQMIPQAAKTVSRSSLLVSQVPNTGELAHRKRAAQRETGNEKPETGSPLASFVDVFCERGAFTLEETQQIFAVARQHGLGVRAHLGQLSQATAAELLAFDPASLDHMDHIGKADLPKLARSNTVVTLLPGANYFLGFARYAAARRLIDTGVAVALATDFNPGTSPTASMPMVLSLACTHLRMSPEEVITAATINGAAALRLTRRKGSIESGKDADLAIFDVHDYRELAYWFGENLCWAVVNRGRFQPVQ